MSQAPILIDFAAPDGAPRRRVFRDPVQVLVARELAEVRPLLQAVDAAARQGLWAAGFVGYAAAPAFDPALRVRPGGSLPLAWFGLFEHPAPAAAVAADQDLVSAPVSWQPTTARADYDRAIAAIREAIAAGVTYQANYTIRLETPFAGDAAALYRRLHAAQPAPFSAFVDTGDHAIVSLSPELFFARRDGTLTCRPMKGTARRGRWLAEDDACRAALMASAKDRAENLMIVDLVRNDLGRIAEVGSVRVPALFAVERYPTVWQLTSTVTARERPGTTLDDIFAALFPCGSITGAPKIETMRLIADLEQSPRDIYCGAIGLVEPGGAATFNVAIRTVLVDRTQGLATYGVGGGITWDSTAAGEYAEVLAKAAVLGDAAQPFALLETLRLRRGRYALLDGHLRRLAGSARYFGIPLDLAAVRSRLTELAATAHASQRVRLLVAQDGALTVEAVPLPPPQLGPQRVALARTPIDAADRFLYHKTTRRAVYEAHRALAPDAFDVLLWNAAGELTEFTIGNLVVELDGQRWTPPIGCGLLPGVLRDALVRRGTVRERVLRREDLARASRLWLVNSVRGCVPVTLGEDG